MMSPRTRSTLLNDRASARRCSLARRWPVTLAAGFALASTGCPGRGENAIDTSGATFADRVRPSATGSSSADLPPAPEPSAREDAPMRALSAGRSPPPSTDDASFDGDGEVSALSLRFRVQLGRSIEAPAHLGASTATAHADAQLGAGSIEVTLGDGRTRIVARHGAFGLAEGVRLSGDHLRPGFVVASPGESPRFRVVPPGALRAFLVDGRIDVLPLARASLAPLAEGRRFDRPTVTTRVTTTYGVLELTQMLLPQPSIAPLPSGAAGDAGSSTDAATPIAVGPVGAAPSASHATRTPPRAAGSSDRIERGEGRADANAGRRSVGSGEPLCRALVELVVAEAAQGGAPCMPDRVPIAATLTYANGGGLTLEADEPKPLTVPRAELVLVPHGAAMAPASAFSATASTLALLDAEALGQLRARGDLSALVVDNHAGAGRFLMLDGGAVAWVASASELTLKLRSGRYVADWRNAIGGAAGAPTEIGVPGSYSANAQSSSSSASAIASARSGP
jgi:hypothetical protein